MIDTGSVAAGIFTSVLALLGLVMASRAVDTGFALFGWALLFFGVALTIGLINRSGLATKRSRSDA